MREAGNGYRWSPQNHPLVRLKISLISRELLAAGAAWQGTTCICINDRVHQPSSNENPRVQECKLTVLHKVHNNRAD